MTHHRLVHRSTAFAVAVVLGLAALATTTGCDPVARSWSWRLGTTHGAIIETTAGRASLGVYRVPSRVLYQVVVHKGVDAAQDAMWALGRPPELKKTFTYRGHSLTLQFGTGTAALRALTKKLIYDDDKDLFGAVAGAHPSDSCVAITLISYGRPVTNWTSKSVGCRDGALA